jgi:hypothetical protein
MKNIHVLPTDKPSRLFMDDKTTNIYLSLENNLFKNGLNIYITSDEEIKGGDYVYDIFKNACPVIRQLKTEEEVLGVQETEFKIILTTDLDLINDGVQAIDDEFLEWFVNNPSCEEVEVKKIELNTDYRSDWKQKFRYKIMIPKEEPKQETLTYTEGAKKVERIFNSTMMAKQETLEGAAERQAERMYSEEEVLEQLNILMSLPFSTLDKFTDDNGNITMKWFEQF